MSVSPPLPSVWMDKSANYTAHLTHCVDRTFLPTSAFTATWEGGAGLREPGASYLFSLTLAN